MVDHRSIILTLLSNGVQISTEICEASSIRNSEALARTAIGYLSAAQSILSTQPSLHSELIDHPNFIILRRLARRFP